jgi:two-component system, chemotaxis family, chemotaxis protein CheV
VGADDFLAKFHPDELAKRVNDRVLAITGESLLPPDEA